jgi:copper/silver efflux system protein
VLVDAAIVMVENGHRHLSERDAPKSPTVVEPGGGNETTGRANAPAGTEPLTEPERRRILLDSVKQVGPAIFFSLVIVLVSFTPVFLLEAQEGRMSRPLAWTKTLAVGFSGSEREFVRTQ